MNTQLAALRLAGQGNEEQPDGELGADRTSVINQVADEQEALDTSLKLLEALLQSIQAVAAEVQRRVDGPASVMFGNLAKGFQVATNNGSISGITCQ